MTITPGVVRHAEECGVSPSQLADELHKEDVGPSVYEWQLYRAIVRKREAAARLREHGVALAVKAAQERDRAERRVAVAKERSDAE